MVALLRLGALVHRILSVLLHSLLLAQANLEGLVSVIFLQIDHLRFCNSYIFA